MMRRFMKRLLWTCCLLAFARLAGASDALLPRPPELEPDVQFWVRVYTQISTNEGFIHDQHELSVVYETLQFDADMPPHTRRQDSTDQTAHLPRPCSR